MYISVKHLNIKQNQDYSGSIIGSRIQKLIICDGIGSYKHSDKYAKIVVKAYLENEIQSTSEILENKELIELLDSNLIGGTTSILASNEIGTEVLKIEYLGNGGIIHTYGDFASNVNSGIPYRYGELMIPHVNNIGELTKHISKYCGAQELTSSKIDLELNYFNGDIVLMFSDGISSLEEKLIINDENGRFWKFEAPSINFILSELDLFLQSEFNLNDFQEKLENFNEGILEKLNDKGFLEDDASLAIVISNKSIEYYKNKLND